MTKNYYQLLGIEKTASALEIKEAYRKLSKKIHPDLNQGEAFFENYFKEVKEAYETLSDRYKKRMYDIETYISAGLPEEKTSGYSKILNYPKIKVLELKLSGLETDFREQAALLLQAEAQREALNQELKQYTAALTVAEKYKEKLLNEMEQLQAYKLKQETEEKAIALHLRELASKSQEQQQVISGLETKQISLTDELQKYRNEENQSARVISDLEIKLQAQNQLIAAIQTEKKALDQQLETYRQQLSETHAHTTILKSKIQELEKNNLANAVKASQPQLPTPNLNAGEKNPKPLVQADAEKKALKQELESYLKKLAEVEHIKQAQQHKIEELALYKASQDAKEKQVQGMVAALEQQLQEQQTLMAIGQAEKEALALELEKYTKELRAANSYKTSLEATLQEKEKEAEKQQREEKEIRLQLAHLETQLQEQQTLLAATQAEKQALKQDLEQTKSEYNAKESGLFSQISGLESKLLNQDKLLTTFKAEITSAQSEKETLALQLEEYTKELQAANDYKTSLEAKLQEKEKEAEKQQREAKEIRLQLAHLETQLQEQQTLLAAAQAEKQALKQDLEQTKSEYNTKENSLAALITGLEEKLATKNTLMATSQAEKETLTLALQERTTELQQASDQQNSLAYKIQELEAYLAAQKTKEQELTHHLTELEATLQHQQGLLLVMENEKEAPLEINQSAATKPVNKVKNATLTVNFKLKEEEKKQAALDNALKKEMGVLKSKLTKIATEQPFIIEEIDFYTSKDTEEGGHSFAAHKIKYVFPRLRVIMLAEQPGQIKLLAKYLKPNGELDFDMRISPRGFSFSETITYKPGDEYIYLAGWGTDKENNFAIGEHTLEIYNESGRQIGKAKFNIVKKLLRFTEMFQK